MSAFIERRADIAEMMMALHAEALRNDYIFSVTSTKVHVSVSLSNLDGRFTDTPAPELGGAYVDSQRLGDGRILRSLWVFGDDLHSALTAAIAFYRQFVSDAMREVSA